VEVMEKQDRREQARDGAMGYSFARHALILNPSSSHCATNRCGSLGNCLRDNQAFDNIHERNGNFQPATFSFVPDVIFVRLPGDSSAHELIRSCRETWRQVSILALVCPAMQRLTKEFTSILRSVDDFLSCPFQDTELFIRIRRILRSRRNSTASTRSGELNERRQLIPIVGESPSFLRIVEKISLLAECRTTVLISGETGTGKEVFSRAIHYQSPRSGKPFVPVNCGALPDHLFENELFGHVKGAFTDASSAEKGLIAEAEEGTLFLDEIDTLSPAGQVKLLRFLQDGEYRPVGSARSVNADVRVIAATNTDLKKRVEEKLFREDLYYRLNPLSLSIPSLHDRIEDVVPLTAHFLDRYAREHGQDARAISAHALNKLMDYLWPGNVRELESVITRALTFTRSPVLQPEDFELPSAPGDASPRTNSLREAKNKTIATFERRYLAGLLAQHRGNVTHAAIAAGKERRSFQRLLRKHNLDRHSFDG
jgi:two-component system response regulator AtoC